MKNDIRKIALSSLLSALIVVLVLFGTFIDLLDITVAAICALIINIVQIEVKGRYPFLVYVTSSILCLIFTPLSTATLYFIGYFGYYPIIKTKLTKLKKVYRKLICVLFFNVAMCLLMLLFKAVFALQNEPWQVYFALIITLNIFFICFDYLLDVFIFIYYKKIRTKIKFLNR